MAEKKKWENLSSDDEDTYERKPKPQVEEKQPEPQETEEATEETHEQKPQRQYTEKRKLPDKGEMIDEIKKMENNVVSINIFRVEEKVTAKEIYGFFKDVKIMKIFKEQRPGQFTLDFDSHDNAIHFVKVAPRPMNGKKFMMRISNKKPKFDNADWNEIGMGGRLIRQIPRYERTGNKFQDKAPKHPEKTYNRKNVNDVFPEDTAEHSLPVKEQAAVEQKEEVQQQQEQQQEEQEVVQEKKPYYKKHYKREEHHEGQEYRNFTKKGFYNPNKGGSKPEETKEGNDDGFTTVGAKKENKQNKQQEQKPERKVQKTEDGWNQVGGEKKQQQQQPKKPAPKKQVVQQEKPAPQKEAPKNKFNALEGW